PPEARPPRPGPACRAGPRARPPIGATVPARLAAALAAMPLQSPTSASSATATIRPRPTSIRAEVYAPPRSRRIGVFPMAIGAASIALLLGAVLILQPGSKPNQIVAAETDAPTATNAGIALGSEAPATDASAPAARAPPGASSAPPTGGGGT